MIRSALAVPICVCCVLLTCVLLTGGMLGCDASKRPARDGTGPTPQGVAQEDATADTGDASSKGSGSVGGVLPPDETDSAESGESDRDRELSLAYQLSEQRKFVEAVAILKRRLVADPDDVEVIFTLASTEAAQGNLAAAVELLDGIPSDHPEAGIPAMGQSADWCLELGRYEEAERRYREVLRKVPDAFPARRQLAFLLNRQGRRHEAAAEVRELCRIGNVRQDELHSLIMLSHAMYDDPKSVGSVNQGVVYAPIGPGGIARKLFTDGKFAEAADTLESWVGEGTALPPPSPSTAAHWWRPKMINVFSSG